MIYIRRTDKPRELTDEVQNSLTEAFLEDNKKKVWNQPYIRAALLEMTHNKCCYCEKRVGKGTVDMHVDHFKPKSRYPKEVVAWNNLLPSCVDCNRNKSNHDTCSEPIINPTVEDPKEFFYLKDYRYKSFDTSENSKANVTIQVLGLNDLERQCVVRFQVAVGIMEQLSDICQYAKEHINELPRDTRKRNKVVGVCRNLLSMCIPSAEYSAFTATALQTDSDYVEIKEILKSINQWDDELEALDQKSKQCVYRTTRF